MNKDLAKKNNNLKVRIPMYFVGLFLMTIGIAISVKSNLGVSPVSSIPYTMTCVWGIEGNNFVSHHSRSDPDYPSASKF